LNPGGGLIVVGAVVVVPLEVGAAVTEVAIDVTGVFVVDSSLSQMAHVLLHLSIIQSRHMLPGSQNPHPFHF